MGSTGSDRPWVTVAILGMVLAFALAVILTDNADEGIGQTLLLTIGSSVPGLVAAGYAERASRKADNITNKLEDS